RHDLRIGRNQCYQPGDESPVTGYARLDITALLQRIFGRIEEVPAVHVVHEAVIVVVDVVVRDFARVGPEVVSEVRMVSIDPSINEGNNHTRAARTQLDCFEIPDKLLRKIGRSRLPGGRAIARET